MRTSHLQMLQDILMNKLNECCPLKTTKVSSRDKAWMNAELRVLKRKRMREWIKNGKTEKYNKLAKEFEQKYNAAAEKYLKSKKDGLKEAKPGKAYSILKSMGAQPGDCSDATTFTLPVHQNENLTIEQSAERIAEHFASISREFEPLDTGSLLK